MRNIIYSFVLISYLLTTSGLAVKLHYCDSELNQVSFVGSAANCGCDEEEASGCCEDQHYYFKIKTDHLASVENILPTHSFGTDLFLNQEINLNEGLYSKIHQPQQYIHGPPGYEKHRIHLLIERFTC